MRSKTKYEYLEIPICSLLLDMFNAKTDILILILQTLSENFLSQTKHRTRPMYPGERKASAIIYCDTPSKIRRKNKKREKVPEEQFLFLL